MYIYIYIIQYDLIETLGTGYFFIQSFINIVLEFNMSCLYKLSKAFRANYIDIHAYVK